MIINVKIPKRHVFYLYLVKGFGWFRFFGKGLEWKDTTTHYVRFSERNKFRKSIKIGKYLISRL